MKSHATSPFALPLGGDRFRVYFSTRDAENRASIGHAELDLGDAPRLLSVAERPVLAPGPLGHFDDHGVYARCLVEAGGRHWMYYLGWNPGARPPLFYCAIGLASSGDGGLTFARESQAPIIDRCDVDPWCVLLPWVMREDGRWRMWYAAGIEWREVEGKLQSYYHIKYAESEDGRAWKREGLVCIPLREGESNIGHPCVVRHDGRYHMWYSYDRGQRYRIGYAESEDGLAWTRRDAEAGIAVSETGWDSEMVCQPYVFRHRDRWLMLYNGNAFGRDGIGLAVAHDE